MIEKVALFILAGAAFAHAGELPAPVSDADYVQVDPSEARLGQNLFYDPILSGNRNIACATCHHPNFATSDGVSLSIGEGGLGLGPDRQVDPDNPPQKRIPRNSPALFNLGAYEFTVMFHDGRLEADPARPGGLRTPMDADMVSGFANVLSAQTMFPVLSRDEMAGAFDENEIGRAVRQGLITGPDGAWTLLADRVRNIPAYAVAFQDVYPHITSPDDIDFTDISNAISAFVALEWRADGSAFDAFLRGEGALDAAAQAGMTLFYGKAGCADCHSGPFQTDHGFHAMAAPQIGPGKAADFETHQRDEGRFRVTGDPADIYAFRTPSLRNVLHTAPYGHAGAHLDLAAFLRAHADPVAALDSYDPSQAILPAFDSDDFAILGSPADLEAIRSSVTRQPIRLGDDEIEALIAFLASLSDPASIAGRLGIPATVPSGLPVPR